MPAEERTTEGREGNQHPPDVVTATNVTRPAGEVLGAQSEGCRRNQETPPVPPRARMGGVDLAVVTDIIQKMGKQLEEMCIDEKVKAMGRKPAPKIEEVIIHPVNQVLAANAAKCASENVQSNMRVEAVIPLDNNAVVPDVQAKEDPPEQRERS